MFGYAKAKVEKPQSDSEIRTVHGSKEETKPRTIKRSGITFSMEIPLKFTIHTTLGPVNAEPGDALVSDAYGCYVLRDPSRR